MTTPTVTRDVQTLPIVAPVSQGAAHVSGTADALDGATIQEPFVILLDENDPSRKVSPAGEETLESVLAAVQGSLYSTVASFDGNAIGAIGATFLLANADRRGVQVTNDAQTSTLFLIYGTGAGTTNYTVKLPPQGYFEMPGDSVYLGIISGAWDASEVGAFAVVTEIATSA